jgi:hypothetical protein
MKIQGSLRLTRWLVFVIPVAMFAAAASLLLG